MWGSRESQQHAGLCQLNTARSWRKAMTALSSDTGITWGGKFSRKTEPAKPGSSHRRIDGEIEMVQSRHKENIFHSEDKKNITTGTQKHDSIFGGIWTQLNKALDSLLWLQCWSCFEPWMTCKLPSHLTEAPDLYRLHKRNRVKPKAKQAIIIWSTDKLILIAWSE